MGGSTWICGPSRNNNNTQDSWRCGSRSIKSKNVSQKIKNDIKLTSTTLDPSQTQISSSLVVPAKADSGASRHYMKESDQHVLTNISSSPGPTVYLPDNNTMTSMKAGDLPFPSILSSSAKKAHVFRDLQSASLVSLGQLCDFLDKELWGYIC